MSLDIKEHVAITIMSSTASSSALAISIFAAQDLYYNVRPNVAVGIFTFVSNLFKKKKFVELPHRLIGSQLIGYGLSGASIFCLSFIGDAISSVRCYEELPSVSYICGLPTAYTSGSAV